MRAVLALLPAIAPGAAEAASGPFFSLSNTNFVVLVAFLLFVAVLVHFKVPGMLGGLLDRRAAQIRADLEGARALRDEAQALVATYERRSREVKDQADRIVARAREDARTAAEEAKEELRRSIARRLADAEDQIRAAEEAALREVRDRAIVVAVAAAGDVIARQMTPAAGAALIDRSITEIGQRLG